MERGNREVRPRYYLTQAKEADAQAAKSRDEVTREGWQNLAAHIVAWRKTPDVMARSFRVKYA